MALRRPTLSIRKQRQLKAQKRRAVVKTLPAPVGGWNARDALSDMPEEDAVALVNFFPETTDVILRYGSELWANLEGSGNQGNAMLLEGTGYATTPDSASVSVTGDIDVRAYANLDDWTPGSWEYFIHKGIPGTDGSYNLFIDDGYLGITIYPAAGGTAGFISDTTVTATNGVPLWVRATVDINDGSGSSIATFYTSTDGSTWTQLGATQSQDSFAAIDDTAAVVELGRGNNPRIACDSADFDGTNDYMLRGTGLTGAADSKSGIVSAWVRLDGGNGSNMVMLMGLSTAGTSTYRFAFYRSVADVFKVHSTDSAGFTAIEMQTVATYTSGSTWHHVLASWDASTGASHLYIDDVSDKSVLQTTDVAGDFTLADWAIGADGSGASILNACLAELYFAPGQYLDFSIIANRRKFVTEAAKPIFLGTDGSLPTGTAPILYLHLDDGEAVANFATDRSGNGNTMTITGTLTTGSDSPSANVTETLPVRYTSGKIYQALIYSGIAGTNVANFNAADAEIGATSVTSSVTGETYTLAGDASITFDPTVTTGSVSPSNQVETLMAYSGGGTRKFFAITAGTIWDITTQDAASIVSAVILGGSRWNYVNIATSGGNYIYMVNMDGLDSPYHYNGTSWTQPSITGVTTANLVNINSHKNRVWFIEKNTLKAWYLPTASVAGAANSLDLSAFFTRGGKLIAMATWTIDAGYGVDDLAVFLTDQGEVAVYRGTDPSSSTTWALVGIYWIGEPIGMRPFVKFSGDCLVITQDGVVPLSGALQSSRTNPRVAITDKIQYAIAQAADLYDENFGWQILPFPRQNMLLLNVPTSEGVTIEQYAMNAITGAWGRFTGWNANCWELFEDEIYYGGTDKTVMKAWTGTSDNNSAIEGAALQAFNYFGSSGQQKRWPMIRPVFLATGNIPLSARLNIDFDQSVVNTDFTNTATVSGAVWDSAVWDVDVWANEFMQSTNWRGGNGVGFCAAPQIGIQTATVHAKWVSTDITVEAGAIL